MTAKKNTVSLCFKRTACATSMAQIHGLVAPLRIAPGTRLELTISLHAFCPRSRVTRRQLAEFVSKLKFGTWQKGAPK